MIKLSQIFFAAIFIYSTSQSIAAANFTGLPWDSLTNFDAWGATNTSTWHAGASSSWSSPGSDLSCPCPQDKRWKVKAACIDVLLPCLHQMFVWLPRISQDHNQWTNEPTVSHRKKKVKTCKRVQHLKIANDFMTHGNGSKPITTILGPALGESTSMYPCPILGHLGSQGCDSGPNHKDVYCLTCVKNIGVDMCNTWGPPQTILSVFCNASLRWRCTSAWLTPFAENGIWYLENRLRWSKLKWLPAPTAPTSFWDWYKSV